MTPQRSTLAAALAALVGGGCAFVDPAATVPPGASVADATRAFGQPTGAYALPTGGKRLEYARGPLGKHTWMLDFDASGTLRTTTQVLTEANFDAIRVGTTRDELLRTIGRPSETRPLARQRQTVWSYRYVGPFCRWFEVGLDAGGKVVDSGYSPDPMCEDNVTDRGGG